MNFGFDWPSGVREENVKSNGHIHVYSPGAGADNPCFHKDNYSVNLVFCCKFSPLNSRVTVSPIQRYR